MSDTAPRQEWMSTLAKAPPEALAKAVAKLGDPPAFVWLRAPEQGAVMVRGRTGGTGAAFNLGEMTVTRCTLRLDDGAVGHAYVPGRDKTHAEHAALCDAMLQGAEAARVDAAVIQPIRADLDRARRQQAARAEDTKVDFFTMVRGEG